MKIFKSEKSSLSSIFIARDFKVVWQVQVNNDANFWHNEYTNLRLSIHTKRCLFDIYAHCIGTHHNLHTWLPAHAHKICTLFGGSPIQATWALVEPSSHVVRAYQFENSSISTVKTQILHATKDIMQHGFSF